MQAKLSQVTKAEVQRVATTYLKEANRTVVTTLPKATATPTDQ
jgi:predicted Zn-dependent peptidase